MSAEQVLVVTLDELDTVFTRRQAFDRWKVEMMGHGVFKQWQPSMCILVKQIWATFFFG